MVLLAAKDGNFIADNVRKLIEGSGQSGARYIPDAVAENLYGKNGVSYVEDESFSLELQNLSAETLTKLTADAIVNILPEQELNPQDRVQINGSMYKALSVEEQNCFGVVSHKTVRLVKHHVS